MSRPLEGLLVLEFAQFMAGPWCGLRLADMGATVIKVERPVTGEAGRALATKNMFVDGDSLVAHLMNRNKGSFAADLKDPHDLAQVRTLIAGADVMTHNFRPGVMERIGLDYETVRELNPRMIYGTVTGYGTDGPWRDKPGQDLLAQSLSGLPFWTGRADDPPVPFGLSVADGICSHHLCQGILAALVRRGRTGEGARIEVSLLESVLDLQFEGLTTYLNDGGRPLQRSAVTASHPLQGAPYGIYPAADGFLALAMGGLDTLADALGLDELHAYDRANDDFERGDEIRQLIAAHVRGETVQYWLDRLEPAGIWCAPVLRYDELRRLPGYQALQMEQTVTRDGEFPVHTLRSPIRIDGERPFAPAAAPRVGRDNERLVRELIDG
jgi:crotonobetainyl-CoA:carnitine CoA-transferase CaiB-like acyl-CoA transferase